MTLFDSSLLPMYCRKSDLWFEASPEVESSDEYIAEVRKVIGPQIRMSRQGTWTVVDFPGRKRIDQGWKIHVSATSENAREILRRSVPIIAGQEVSFKFQSDAGRLIDINSRVMTRGAGCKFVTVYPYTEDQCRDLLEKLYSVLHDFAGPKVLSDRQFRDCKVLHYRYGGHQAQWRLTPSGVSEAVITDPTSGETVPDLRNPFWSPPAWVTSDPFSTVGPAETAGGILLGGRYRVDRAIQFTNVGGVYVGYDGLDEREVLIKEARPGTDSHRDGMDAVTLRANEFDILKRIEALEISARPIDYFLQDKHAFLVTEYYDDATDLLRFITSSHPMMTLATDGYDAYFETCIHVWRQLAGHLEALHDRELVYGDLSLKNVMLRDSHDDQQSEIRLIDFEAAFDVNSGSSPGIITPGISPLNLRQSMSAQPADDVFCLGMVILATLFLSTEPAIRDRRQLFRILSHLAGDMPIPHNVESLIADATDPDPRKRPSIRAVRERLDHVTLRKAPVAASPLESVNVKRIISGIEFSATPQRIDRVYPGDPTLYATNPVSVAFGVAGVARALAYVGHPVPGFVKSRLMQFNFSDTACPPGLYGGMAGVAWTASHLGMKEYGRDLILAANAHPLVGTDDGLLHGDAGLGLANLHMWTETGDQHLLECAVRIGDRFTGLSPLGHDRQSGVADLGLAFGDPGPALLLLYLTLASGDDKYAAHGLKLIRGVAGMARDTGYGYHSMPENDDPKSNIVSPYWLNGSAGVGAAVLRYSLVFPEEGLSELVTSFARDATRMYTFMPGYYMGLAGLGDYLLDVYHLTGDRVARRGADRVATGLNVFAKEHQGHFLFPGNQLLRHSSDFATGSAGIAMFLHRRECATADPGPVQLLPDQLLRRFGVMHRKEVAA